MTAFALKIIACITMLIDHIGLVFDSELASVHPALPLVFRCIGRLAFPLFAFGIAEGAAHTSSPKKYLARMGLFALIAQLPFMLMVGTHFSSFTVSLGQYTIPLYSGLSVMVTLLLGLCVCLALKNKKPIFAALALGVGYLLDSIIGMDYGILGILFVVSLYFAREHRIGRSLILVLFAACFYISPLATAIKHLFGAGPALGDTTRLIKFAAMCVPALLLLLYNGRQGIKAKYLIYAFYPVHMLLLWTVWALMHVFNVF